MSCTILSVCLACAPAIVCKLNDDDTPGVLDGTRLDADQLLPDRARDGSHAIRTRRNVDVLAKVAYSVHRTDDSRST